MKTTCSITTTNCTPPLNEISTSAFCAATFMREVCQCARLRNTPCSRKPSNPWCSSNSSSKQTKVAGGTRDRVGAVHFFWQQEGPPRKHARLVTCHSLPQHLPRGLLSKATLCDSWPQRPLVLSIYIYIYIYLHTRKHLWR